MKRPPIVELGQPTPSSPERVPRMAIVIERDADLRETLTEYLLSLEHQVLAFSTTPQPDELRRLQPDLLVIDLMCEGSLLPIDTLRQIKRAIAASPMVATSADSHSAAAYPDELSSVATALLIKPFDLDHFDHAAGLGEA
jgi:DNA-binding response OmpR family regulator